MYVSKSMDGQRCMSWLHVYSATGFCYADDKKRGTKAAETSELSSRCEM